MGRSDSLIQLIQSLSRTEKRNFKLLTRITSGEKGYLNLFDQLDKSDPNSQVLGTVSSMSKEGKRLAVTKNYLYNNVLRSLAFFSWPKNHQSSYRMAQIQLLSDRGLYHQAYKQLRKEKLFLQKAEDFAGLCAYLSKERELILHSLPTKQHYQYLSKLHVTESEVLSRHQNLQHFQQINDQVEILFRFSHQGRTATELKTMGAFFNAPQESNPLQPQSVKASILDGLNRGMCSYFNANPLEAHTLVTKVVHDFKKHPEIIQVWTRRYIEAIYFQGLCSLNLGKAQLAKSCIEELGQFPTDSHQLKALCQTYHRNLDLYLRLLNPQGEEIRLSSDPTLNYGNSDHYPEPGIGLLYLYGGVLAKWFAGNFSQAIKWTNHFFNGPRTESRTDLQGYIRILSLIFHYEQKNYDLFEHQLKSTQRFFHSRKRFFPLEQTCLKLFRELAHKGYPRQSSEPFQSSYSELTHILNDQKEAAADRVLFFQPWLQSKLKGSNLMMEINTMYRNS